MSKTETIEYERLIPDILHAMANVHTTIMNEGFDRTIHHLVQLRASQLNRCGFCIKMHTREALQDGETHERLERLVVWDQLADYSAREKAALAWTEALTRLDVKEDFAGLKAELRRQFSDEEVGVLTATIAMINLWNRINAAKH